ncbi:hypothetical protein JCM11491_007230 [Sporobolomyces phaffii]
MSLAHDPTNANAVPGSSKHPYSPAPVPPAPPALARIDPSGSAPPTTGPTSSAPAPAAASARRRADGPIIVPTVVASDGVREVPQLFEHCHVDDLIALIASMLDRLIEHNDRIPLTPNSLTRFHSRAPPSIGVRDYLLRIARYTNVEPCCLLILLPYVDKVCARMNTFTISSLTVHRFIIAAVSVGSKALSDAFCTNGRYSRVGGVSIVEMNLLEKEFCEAIDWRLTTSGSVLAHYYTSLVRSHPKYRLSTAPLPERDPPTEPAPPVPFSVVSNGSSSTTTTTTTGSSPRSVPPSSTSSSSTAGTGETSGARDDALSDSMSVDPAPNAPSSPPPPPPPPSARPPASSSASPSLVVLGSNDPSPVPPPPPLVPPNLSRRIISASNLPSPNPPPHPRPVATTTTTTTMAPPTTTTTTTMTYSPAKRGRRRSTSSDASSSAGSSTMSTTTSSFSSSAAAAAGTNVIAGGGGRGGGGPGSGSTHPATRFAPSPRLSATTSQPTTTSTTTAAAARAEMR